MNHAYSPKRRSSASGFTLLEVLVVVVIVAVLAGIAAPGWLAFMNRQRTSTVKNDIAESLRQAQTNAIQLRSDRTITVLTNADLPSIQIAGLTEEIGSGIPPGTITLSTNRNSNAITFDYQGVPSNPGEIPFVITVRPSDSPADSQARQCVAVTTVLGNIKTANSGDDCDALLAL